MNILITGAKGFVGKNLCAQLKNIKEGKARWYNLPEEIGDIYEYDIDSTSEELEYACEHADFVFNLAGVNRPKDPEEFMKGNFGFATTLLNTLKKYNNTCPVMISSSVQATLAGRFGNSEYGRSKKAGEELMFQYGEETGAKVLVYRFPNLFGKWCRPNYNSAVATFCNNIANDLPIQVNDPNVDMELLYIDDLVDEMIAALKGEEHYCTYDGVDVVPAPEGFCEINKNQCNLRNAEYPYCCAPITHKVKLGEIVDLLHQFAEQPKTLMIPEIPANSFAKKLYSTYLSYLPKEKAIYDLKMNVDNRGSFTELVHTEKCGQVSINISKPGITKGQHWHNTKWELFIVVKGHGLIQLRKEISLTQPSPQERAIDPWNTADPSLYAELKQKAETMRNNPTEAESALWQMLKGKSLDAKFRRQHIIGDYIVDFVCLESQLVVEVDGGYHNSSEQQEQDKHRTAFLQSKGFNVLRFTNEEVLANTEGVLTIIRNALKYLTKNTSLLKGDAREGVCLSTPEGGVGRGPVLNYLVSGNQIQVVHMLPGYTHNIINLSETENLVTVMYCNEIFNPNRPDTYFDPV